MKRARQQQTNSAQSIKVWCCLVENESFYQHLFPSHHDHICHVKEKNREQKGNILVLVTAWYVFEIYRYVIEFEVRFFFICGTGYIRALVK